MFRITLVCLCPVVFCFNLAIAHPVDFYEPNEVPSSYSGLPSDFSINEITFASNFPDSASMTAEERYMIAGARKPGGGGRLLPWQIDIYCVVSSFYATHGYLPNELTEEMVRAVNANPSQASLEWIERFKSPLTGQFPILNAAWHSPGDVFIAVLTEQEKRHLASYIERYERNWYGGEIQDPWTGDWVPAKLVGEVFYIRVYGYDGVIANTLQYHISPETPIRF